MTDFIARFECDYAPRLGVRRNSFSMLMREAIRRNVCTIIETGSLRDPGNWEGDGQSTVIFNDYAGTFGAEFTTIDIDYNATTNAELLCPNAGVINADSLTVLKKLKGTVDLLYLDANGHDDDALWCMFEFCAAQHLIKSGTILCTDDSPYNPDWTVRGKGKYVAEYLRRLNIKPFILGYQTAWIMP